MSFDSVLQAFVTVFPAELPDKSMFATLALTVQLRRPLWIWLGVVAAFAVHVTVAVAAGSVLGLLPDVTVALVTSVLFAAGAVLLARAARAGERRPLDAEAQPRRSRPATVAAGFGVIIVAEWGDLTQLATAGLSARSGEPVATAVGAWLALACVAALAAGLGRQISDRVPLHRVNYLGATVFASLAAWTLIDLVR